MKKIKKTKTDIAREYIKEITGADIVKTELQRTHWNTKEVYMEKAYLLDGKEISGEKSIRDFADALLSTAEDIQTIKDAGRNISVRVRGGGYRLNLYIDGEYCVCCEYGNTNGTRFIARCLRGELTLHDKLLVITLKDTRIRF